MKFILLNQSLGVAECKRCSLISSEVALRNEGLVSEM